MRIQLFDNGPEMARCLAGVSIPGIWEVHAFGRDEAHARILIIRKLMKLARDAEELAETIALDGNELIAAMGDPRTNAAKPWA